MLSACPRYGKWNVSSCSRDGAAHGCRVPLGVLVALVGVSGVGCGAQSKTVTRSVSAQSAYLPSACTNQVQRPSGFFFACADGQAGLEHIEWEAGWGNPTASGKGFAFLNDCEPSCVAGGTHQSPAEIYATDLKRCPNGRMQYRRLGVIAAKSSIASRTSGVYSVACGEQGNGSVTLIEPGE